MDMEGIAMEPYEVDYGDSDDERQRSADVLIRLSAERFIAMKYDLEMLLAHEPEELSKQLEILSFLQELFSEAMIDTHYDDTADVAGEEETWTSRWLDQHLDEVEQRAGELSEKK